MWNAIMILNALIFLAQSSIVVPDCGLSRYHTLITKTQTLIKKSVQPNFKSELITMGELKNVCVRVEFTINKNGKAEHVRVVEGFDDHVFDRAVIEALRQF